MIIKLVKTSEAVNTIENFIAKQKFGFAYCIHNQKCVFSSQTSPIDREICLELGYDILETKHSGGAVVVEEGDLSIVYFGELGNGVMHQFTTYLMDYYQKQGLHTSFDGNDVLIDGYKISGLSATRYGRIQYSTIHIGINTNLEHIKMICKKPMVKTPKGLSDYNITAQDIEKVFLNFVNNELQL